MTRLERTYALFGGMVVSVVLAGIFAQADLSRVTLSLGLVAGLLFAAILVENSNVA